ncbi:hypothetical protein PMAYCL1PPCAC_33077, partial [Pristionchus mayeri]
SSINVTEAIEYNERESRKVYFDLPLDCVRDFQAEKWTGLKEEPQMRCISKGNGTAKVLLIGNSYGYRTFPVLHELFAGRYEEFRLFTKSSRMFLNKDPLDASTFKYWKLAKRVIKHSKPDIIFVIEKDMEAAQNKPYSGSVEDDHIFNFTQSRIRFLSEHAKFVVIDDQYYKPHLASGVAATIVERLRSGKKRLVDFTDLNVSTDEYLEEFKYGKRRFHAYEDQNLMKNRVEEQLCPNEPCYFFNLNNLHAYYGDAALHQTTEMIRKLKHGYKLIIKHFLKEHE